METALAYTRRILKKYELRAKKSLGQNFLIDDAVISEIVEGSGLGQEQAVLEIGPGTGALTRALVKHAGHVWAVELDGVLCDVLRDEFKQSKHVEIIHGDALDFDAGTLESPGRVKLIANLPYYITSPLIRRFLAQRRYFESMTFMVQQEVAGRITAAPGKKDYGILSVAVQVFCQARLLCTVPASAFIPQPKVNSAVIRLDMLSQPLIEADQEEAFFRTVKGAFGQRRKTLVNSLCQGLNLKKEDVTSVVESLGIPPQARAETLSLNDFIRLSQALETQ